MGWDEICCGFHEMGWDKLRGSWDEKFVPFHPIRSPIRETLLRSLLYMNVLKKKSIIVFPRTVINLTTFLFISSTLSLFSFLVMPVLSFDMPSMTWER